MQLLGDCSAKRDLMCFPGGQDSSSGRLSPRHAVTERLAERTGTHQGSSGMSQLHWLPSQSASKWAEPNLSLTRALPGGQPTPLTKTRSPFLMC